MNKITLPDIPQLRGPVTLSHLHLRSCIRAGDHVVDATCGNGSDTLLLAELVGDSGHVWAFDIQAEAIRRTTSLLADKGLLSRVTLIPHSHQSIAEQVQIPLAAIVFNLGYLPGGDHSIITQTESTIQAIKQGLPLLLPGGIMTICLYPGHNGGDDEQQAIMALIAGLNPRVFHVWRMGQVNVTANAPLFILIQKAR